MMEAREARGLDDPAAWAKLITTVVPDEQVDLWLAGVERSYEVSFRSRRGPGGSVDISAASVSSFLMSYLVQGPRRGVVKRAFDMSFAQHTPLEGKQDLLCPLTRALWFGDALIALLTERSAFDRAVAIRVSHDRGMARISFEPSPGQKLVSSTFVVPGKPKPDKAFFRESNLILRDVRWLFDLLNEGAHAATRAKAPS